MKCWKCRAVMMKDEQSRTATCPCCGRTVQYQTRREKRGPSSGPGGRMGCSSVLGRKILAILAILLLIVGVYLIVSGIYLAELENAL